jgi:hypothetical protein
MLKALAIEQEQLAKAHNVYSELRTDSSQQSESGNLV